VFMIDPSHLSHPRHGYRFFWGTKMPTCTRTRTCPRPQPMTFPTKTNDDQYRQSGLMVQAIHRCQCTRPLQFHHLPHHTTSANTRRLSIHALLHHFLYSDDVHPYRLPFVNVKNFTDDDYQDRSWALPWLVRDVVHQHQHASSLPLRLPSQISFQILVNGNWIRKMSTQRHHLELLPQLKARVAYRR